jgi:hypothetical protein
VGLFSSKSSSSTSTATTNNMFDQRQVVDAGGGLVGDANYLDSSNRSVTSFDGSDRSTRSSNDDNSTWIDSSNRSSTVLNYVDPGTVQAATQLARFNNELAQASFDSTNDTARVLGQMAIQYGAGLGESVTDLYSSAGQNNTKAWSHTLNASERLMAGILDGATRTTQTAANVATSAISAFQPAENKQAETMGKMAMLAAGLAVAFFVLRK